MTAQWERVNPVEHDYDERWDHAHDGYVRAFVHRTIKAPCELCGRDYAHFFVSHGDWLRVPLEHRSKRLCVDCYASVS